MQFTVTRLDKITIEDGIFSGYSFRGKIENEPDGNVSVIQMRDLYDNYSKISHNLIKVRGDKIKSRYYLKRNDILFIAKGSNNYALVYDSDHEIIVASSAFFVIRINQTQANPFFVAWYINQSKVQQFLTENMAGTYIPNVNKITVEEIKILLPPLETQNYISELYSLIKREAKLREEINNKRKLLLESILCQTIKNIKNG